MVTVLAPRPLPERARAGGGRELPSTRLQAGEGLHRLEACKLLGEATITGYLVQARRH